MPKAKSMSRVGLLRDVSKRTNYIVNYHHVSSVITILFEEMLKDLLADKKIQVIGFGMFKTKITKSHRYYNFYHKKMMMAASYRRIKLKLTFKLLKKLSRLWDLDKQPTSP